MKHDGNAKEIESDRELDNSATVGNGKAGKRNVRRKYLINLPTQCAPAVRACASPSTR